MKIYQLTNKKTGKLIPRKMSAVEHATLCNTFQPGSTNLKMIELYMVEEFDVNVREGQTFQPFAKPDYIKEGMSTGATAVAPKQETKGSDASDQQ